MAEPLAFFVAPRQQPPLPIGKADAAQVRQWAAETELDTVAGGTRRGGRFRVEVSAAADQQTAVRDYGRLRQAGYPAVMRMTKTGAGPEYRVRIVNLTSERDAQAVAEKVKALGFSGAAIGRQPPLRGTADCGSYCACAQSDRESRKFRYRWLPAGEN